MVTKSSPGTELFLEMWSKWWTALPDSLVNEDPRVLIRLLKLGVPDEGISQADLKRELGINQPRLSKFMKKLLMLRWIKVRESGADGRLRLMTTTAIARDRIASLEAEFAALLPAGSSTRTRRKGVRVVQEGQQPFFELEE